MNQPSDAIPVRRPLTRAMGLLCAASAGLAGPVVLAGTAQAATAPTSAAAHQQVHRLDARLAGSAARVVIRAGRSGLVAGARRPSAMLTAPSASLTGAATSTFQIAYTGSWPAEAQAAFNAAAATWSHVLVSSVPIRVSANWSALDPGVLGSAGPSGFYEVNGRWVPQALADAVSGSDRDPAVEDIDASFSSDASWYLGTDGRPPVGQWDLETVVTHELGHGLGFIGSLDDNTSGVGTFGASATVGGTRVPFAMDDLVVDGSGHQLDTTYRNDTALLGDVLSGSAGTLRLKGAAATAANGGVQAPLFTPNPYQEGSSTFHLDEDSYPEGSPNALMTPILPDAESDHSVGPVVTGLMKDLGWSVASAAPTAIQTKYAALGGATSVVGTPVGGEYAVLGGSAQNYTKGRIYWSSTTGAHEVHGLILNKYLAVGGPGGVLRLPTSDELVTPGGASRYTTFTGGRVYWSSATSAHEVHGLILQRYLALGGALGVLRLPTSDELASSDGAGRYTAFSGSGGAVYWSGASGAHAVYGSIRTRWAQLGAERGRLGYPTTDEYAVTGGRRSSFQHGSITWASATGAITVVYS